MTSSRRAAGRLIVLEGPDGVGKSTFSGALAAHLLGRGEDVALLAFPGRNAGTLGKLVYDVHHDPAHFSVEQLGQASKQALHIAAHLDAIEHAILPALRVGRHVILDRFWWSTMVYGIVGGVQRRVLRGLINAELAQWSRVRPALAILIRRDAPIDRQHDEADWIALRREYDTLADRESQRYPVLAVQNVGSLEETLAEIISAVDDQLRPVRVPKRPPWTSQSEGHPELQTGAFRDAASSEAPTVISPVAPARASAVYDTYWRFAAERQQVFFRRLEGAAPPWTNDPVLARYKFTNAYRASDRVSQYLIRRVIYRDELPSSPEEIFFRIVLFKLFNKVATWERLERAFGAVSFADYRFDRYDAVLTDALRAGQPIYSAAYIMPPGKGSVKHHGHLRLIEKMMRDGLAHRLASARSMQIGFELLRSYPTIGDFLAYQFVTDVNYSELTRFSEMEFVVPGPGALNGIRKCFVDQGGLNDAELIRRVADQQEQEFDRLGLGFRSLWGRPLQLIDCQNLFCEVDKYARVAHPEVGGGSRRTRIKQRFVPTGTPLPYWYPPKWGINEDVECAQPQHQAEPRTGGG